MNLPQKPEMLATTYITLYLSTKGKMKLFIYVIYLNENRNHIHMNDTVG